jgi:hypothetical protein
MSNAQNGARIKAWAGSGVGSGIVKNITFMNFIESKVDNPVVIDQCYMTSAAAVRALSTSPNSFGLGGLTSLFFACSAPSSRPTPSSKTWSSRSPSLHTYSQN